MEFPQVQHELAVEKPALLWEPEHWLQFLLEQRQVELLPGSLLQRQ